MESINIRDLLTRNGWKIEESRENEELRSIVIQLEHDIVECERTYNADREAIAKQYIIESGQHDILKEKYTIVYDQLKHKEEQYEYTLEKFLKCQQEAHRWMVKYEEQKKENEVMRMKLERWKEMCRCLQGQHSPNNKQRNEGYFVDGEEEPELPRSTKHLKIQQQNHTAEIKSTLTPISSTTTTFQKHNTALSAKLKTSLPTSAATTTSQTTTSTLRKNHNPPPPSTKPSIVTCRKSSGMINLQSDQDSASTIYSPYVPIPPTKPSTERKVYNQRRRIILNSLPSIQQNLSDTIKQTPINTNKNTCTNNNYKNENNNNSSDNNDNNNNKNSSNGTSFEHSRQK